MRNVDIELRADLHPSRSPPERRAVDRRRGATPMWCRYTLLGGRRCGPRRSTDQKVIFVDQHGRKLLAVVLLIVALNVLDAWFTIFLLSYGGTELNPIVRWVLAWLGVMPFILLKTAGIGVCVGFLALTKNFMPARIGMTVVLVGYLALACWHFYLLEWLEL